MKDERTGQEKGPAKAAMPKNLERNTLTLSLVVVVLALICLPHVPTQSDTWYVLMIVFFINAVLILWILWRIIRRRSTDGRA